MADNERGFAVARQTTLHTPAATPYALNAFTDFQIKPEIGTRVPKFKTNSAIEDRYVIPTTRQGTATGTFEVEPTDLGWLLLSVLGLPTGPTSNAFTFLHGTPSPPPLTFWKEMGLPVYEQLYDAAITSLVLTLAGEQGTWTGTMQAQGAYNGPLATPPTFTYAPIPQNSLMGPWQTVCTRTAAGATTAFCVVSLTLTFTREYKPLWCTPTTAPTSSTPAGLAPSRQMQGPAHGTGHLVYEYLGTDYTGEKSSFWNYTRNLPEGWVISMTDPTVYSPVLGYVPTVRIEFPNEKGTAGELPITEPGTMQDVSFTMLYDSTLTSQAKITLINGLTGYPAS